MKKKNNVRYVLTTFWIIKKVVMKFLMPHYISVTDCMSWSKPLYGSRILLGRTTSIIFHDIFHPFIFNECVDHICKRLVLPRVIVYGNPC